jgi:two-component system chemotaxis response regulator CheB
MSPESPLAVVVVDDSAVQRRFFRAAIEAEPGMIVVGEAANGRDAVAMVERLRPGAVLMDLNLPRMNGIEAIERIMATRPTPILVCSAYVEGDDVANAQAALAAGAVDVMAKPGPHDGNRLEEFGATLRARLRVAGRVKVITHPRGRLRGETAGPVVTTRRLAAAPRPTGRAQPPGDRSSDVADLAPRPVRLVAIGASTGGPQALVSVLGALPADLDAAVLVVQHMADGFIEGLAGWLDGLCAMPVEVGRSGRRLAPGTVTVAPSGLNLVVHDGLRVTTEQAPSTQYHVPGIDVTFSSVAAAVGPAAVGVLLTGMGRDGAAGLRRMREAGALTLTQDEATSAVYGMPAAAMAMQAADRQLPLETIGPALVRVVPRALSAGAEAGR